MVFTQRSLPETVEIVPLTLWKVSQPNYGRRLQVAGASGRSASEPAAQLRCVGYRAIRERSFVKRRDSVPLGDDVAQQLARKV